MMISYEGTFAFFQWYKNRGCTAFIKVLNRSKESDEAELLYLLETFNEIELKLKVSESNKHDNKTVEDLGKLCHMDINSWYPRLMANSMYGILCDTNEGHMLPGEKKSKKRKTNEGKYRDNKTLDEPYK